MFAAEDQDRSKPPADLLQPEDAQSELVCYCMHVRAATLRRAVQAGACTISRLGEWTRAGLGCGTCRSELSALIAAECPGTSL